MKLVSQIWKLLTPQQRRQILLAQGISLAMAVSTVTGIASIAPFFAVLGNPGLIDRQPLLHWLYTAGGFAARQSFVTALGFAFITLVVAANIINAVGSAAVSRVARRIGLELQAALFSEYLSRPYLFHAQIHSAKVFSNLVYELERFNNGILQNALLLVTHVTTAALILISVLVLNPTVSILMLLALGMGYSFIYLSIRKRMQRLGEAHARAWAERSRIVSESLGAIREILMRPDRSVFIGAFETSAREVSETAADLHDAAQFPKYWMECLAAGALVGSSLLLSAQGRSTAVWLGELTFIAFAAYRLLPILQQIFACAVRIRGDRPGFALIWSDLKLMRERAARATDGAAAKVMQFASEIRLEQVSFRYAAENSPALSDVNLHIPARAIVGLIGPNGSGKTTLMDVLAGLIMPTTGRLLVDGLRIDDSNREAWRTQIAYVPQEIFLLDASIEENIAFGTPVRAIDRSRLSQAVRLAQLEELLQSLPHGLQHRVGERGVQLSGGQRQKIGIARALYRNSPVLLLDEATSGLDGLSESELVTTLGQLRGRQTIVLISHRMSTLRSCDVIYRLEHGRIVEASHSDLSGPSASAGRVASA